MSQAVNMSSSRSPPMASDGSHQRKRKYKPRASLACDTCRTKKSKCDQGSPCQICKGACPSNAMWYPLRPVERRIPCVYGEKRKNPIPNGSPDASMLSARRFAASIRYVRTGPSPGLQQSQDSGIHFDQIQEPMSSTNAVDVPDNRLNNPNTRPSAHPENDTVAAVNHQTSGTEFYGPSSNVVLVKQLLQHAYIGLPGIINASTSNHAETLSLACSTSPEKYSVDGRRSMQSASPSEGPIEGELSQTPLSVVDLFCDESTEIPDPHSASTVTVAGRARKDPAQRLTPSSKDHTQASIGPTGSSRPLPSVLDQIKSIHSSDCFFGNPMRLEMEYVGLYFENLHLIYPFLSSDAFRSRCEDQIWKGTTLKRLPRSQMHFLALYNAVLAVGALTAPVDALHSQRAELEVHTEEDRRKGPKYVPSSIRLSRLYFQRARRLLGDVFEVCSLEGAQTLLLMSLYCQHALKLHASYMYSGMAMRTAAAIGLSALTCSDRNDVRYKTWACIYVQEVKVSCTSGRSVVVLGYAGTGSGRSQPETNDSGDLQTSMVSAQLGLCQLLQAASASLYHSWDVSTVEERSETAHQLDNSLEQWKTNLPPSLNPDHVSFKESESLSRQKLALQTSYYHVKMFIHRPFLVLSANSEGSSRHISTCVGTAHASITLTYSAFTHRIYTRTWWHNATNTFYSAIIILYVLLMADRNGIVSTACLNIQELTSDIQKTLKMLRAMDAMPVSLRYAHLVEDVLKASENQTTEPTETDTTFANYQIHNSNTETIQSNAPEWDRNFENTNGVVPNHPQGNTYQSEDHNQRLGRDDLLLGLMDPNLFNEFTMGNSGDMSFTFDEDNCGNESFYGLNFASGQRNDLGSWNGEGHS